MTDNAAHAGGVRTHPGSARRAGRAFPKGRIVADADRADVRAALGAAPRERALLIEHLHVLNDRFGQLRKGHLAALADELRLAFVEVHEVASFYAHFDIVEDDAAPAHPVVRVCDGVACARRGAAALTRLLASELRTAARVVPAPCLGACDRAPAVTVGFRLVSDPDAARLRAALAATPASAAPEIGLARYREAGGYALLESCRAGARTPQSLFDALDASGLRGLGGAGFPAGRKWRLVAQRPAPRLIAINADEGEPGTFKDRWFLERDPHRMLEGALIAAWAIAAETVYVYVRDEYPEALAILRREIEALDEAGLLGGVRFELRRGAGAYICGEDSAMLESLEGKRGLPRNRPPYPAEHGLFGRPTLVHNVETLWWVREIVEAGPERFAAAGRRGAKGLRAYSLSGRVRAPGVKIAPCGVTARELIDEFGGGMEAGHEFAAFLPGGASGGILPARLADLALDFGKLEEHGSFVGSGAVVILSQHDDLADVARGLVRFFEDESCGQCTPCRAGTEKATALLARSHWDRDLLRELARGMADASICGLGQAAMNPVLSLLRHFPERVP